MAKKSVIARNNKRKKLVDRYRKVREAFKKDLLKLAYGEEREEKMVKLQKRRRDESPVRLQERCRVCGRSRGTYQKFGLCRIHLREAAVRGDVPGLKKASW